MSHTKILAGTSGYSYKEWKGSFYPADLPAKQMLRHYAERLPAVEANGTFRRLPAPSAAKAWVKEVPADFRFALKAPQQITHYRRLKDCAEPVAAFLKFAAVLRGQLGPLLFQLPPNFKKDVPRLKAFLKPVPKHRRATFEFRHPSWFDQEVYDALSARNVALCIADEDDDLKVPFVATADWGYLRLRRPTYSAAALKAWIASVRNQAWTEAYVFFRHEDEARGPKMAEQFLRFTGSRK
jgi:uncharacterized protein YecE (DUF72 family)